MTDVRPNVSTEIWLIAAGARRGRGPVPGVGG
jgi:hypothetical protein